MGHGRDEAIGLENDDTVWPRGLGPGQYLVVPGRLIAIDVSRMQGESSRSAARATTLLWTECLVAWKCFTTGPGGLRQQGSWGVRPLGKVW